MYKHVYSKLGFSLIELMVVIAIVAILSAVAIPAYNKYIQSARVASIFPLMQNYATIANNYYAKHGYYTSAELMGLNASGTTMNVNSSKYSVPGGEGIGAQTGNSDHAWIVFILDQDLVGNGGVDNDVYEMDLSAGETEIHSAVGVCYGPVDLAPASWSRSNLTSPSYWGFCP